MDYLKFQKYISKLLFEPTKEDVTGELVEDEIEESVKQAKVAAVDTAIEPYSDQAEVSKVSFIPRMSPSNKASMYAVEVPKAGLGAGESLVLPEKQTTPPISPNFSSSGFAISPTLSPHLSSGILLPLLDTELLPPLHPVIY